MAGRLSLKLMQEDGPAVLGYAPGDCPSVFQQHLMIAVILLCWVLMVVVASILSILGWVTGDQRIMFLDPFCGMPLAWASLLYVFIGISTMIVSTAGVRLDENGVYLYMLGMWYGVPRQMLEHASIIDAEHYSAFRWLTKKQKVWIVQVPGLSIVHKLAGILLWFEYKIPSISSFMVKEEHKVYEKLCEMIEPGQPEN